VWKNPNVGPKACYTREFGTPAGRVSGKGEKAPLLSVLRWIIVRVVTLCGAPVDVQNHDA